MKKLFGLICILGLVGCSNNLYPSNYAKAVELCLNNEGLKLILVGPVRYDVTCNNGAQFNGYSRGVSTQK